MPSNIRFINKYNGLHVRRAASSAQRFYPVMAHLAKITGRPVKMMLPKDQELAQLDIKPETITKFKVGATKDGRIIALAHDVSVSVGDSEGGGHASGPGNAANQLELYTSSSSPLESLWSAYRTNAPRPGPSRSFMQQETKWSWENMMDEMADALGIDPVEFRLMHITRPTAGRLASSVRFLLPRGGAGRRSQGFRMGQDEIQRRAARRDASNEDSASACRSTMRATSATTKAKKPSRDWRRSRARRSVFSTELELGADGFVTMKIALPDSGSNAATAHGRIWSPKCSGFTTRDHVRLVWGDSDMAPSSVHGRLAIRSRFKERRRAAQPISCERICFSAPPVS